jgi:hypothetical protein
VQRLILIVIKVYPTSDSCCQEAPQCLVVEYQDVAVQRLYTNFDYTSTGVGICNNVGAKRAVAASINPLNNGCGALGLDLNSG